MAEQMFCFQCEQTAGCSGCTGSAGVCGKKSDTAAVQDKLTGALIMLAAAVKKNGGATAQTDNLMLSSLFTTVTNVSFDNESAEKLIEQVHAETLRISGSVPEDFNVGKIWKGSDKDISSLQTLVLLGLRGTACYAYHAHVIGYDSKNINEFFYKGLAALTENLSVDDLYALSMDIGKINFECMDLLDKANTESFGTPEPTEVSMEIEKGPFIVITGHDLLDLKILLEQTEGKGVNVYTHGEMLPGNAYPELKKYKHLKGNFGTAWHMQQTEFDGIPAPILYTSNCLMPPKPSYSDRIYTTEVVRYPGFVHIDGEGKNKDFSPVINKALELGGYKENKQTYGTNGGTKVMTGFSHGAVLAHAGEIVDAVKAGAIKHFFLVGGCDGYKKGRSYFTDFVKKTPKDTMVLTLACGKYRFNDLDIGKIGPFPRILDMGQCNDAVGAVKVAVALAEAFGCGVNDLPLSYVISWYEQKAVCVLLTMLYLGLQNILLGPSLPAFVSENVLKILVEKFHIAPIGDVDSDMAKMLKKAD